MASNKIRGITIELAADTSGIMDGLKDINRSLSATTKSLNDVNKLLKLDPDNVTLLAQKQDYLTQAIEQTSAKLQKEKELLENMKSADNADQTIEQQRALEREIEATTQKLNGYNKQLEDTSNKLNDVGKESENTEGSVNKTADAIEMIAKSEAFSKIAEDAKKLADAMLECVEVADKFNFSMAKVETLANAGDGLKGLSDSIRQSAMALGVSATDFAEGVYQAMSAGVAAEDAVEFTANMTKLAIGGFTDSATAVDIVTTAINAYGMSMDDATHIMDNLILTQNLGKTTVDELASQMGRVIPIASAYSVNIDNVASAYAELTAKGIKTRIATTDLSAMFNELGDASKGVGEILKELTGQTIGQFMEAGNSLGDVLSLLWDYAEQDKEAFYGLWSQSTAATAAFNLASDGGERFNQILTEMGDNAGLAEQNFATMADTSEMVGQRFETAVENLKIALGDTLSPIIDEVKEKGIEALEPLTMFVEENPEMVTALAGLVAGLIATTTAVTACAAAVAVLKFAFEGVAGLVPILISGGLVGGITALGLSMADASANADKFKKSMQEASIEVAETNIELEADANTIFNLANKLGTLNKVTSLSADEFIEMKDAVEQWNSIASDSNQIIMDETGHIGDLDQATLNYMSTVEGIRALEEEYNNIALEKAAVLEEVNAAQERYEEIELRIASATNMTKVELDYLNGQLKEEQEIIDAGNTKIGEYTDSQVDLNERIKEATEYTKEYEEAQRAEQEETEAVVQANEKLIESYQKAYESALSSLEGQRKAFEEYNTSAGQSVSDLASSFETQATNMKAYAELIAEAYRIMQIDPTATDLLAYYIQQGPSAAGELQNLVDSFNGTAESIEAFYEVVEAFNETLELKDIIGKMQGSIETGYTEPMENALASLEETIPLITEQYQAGYEQQQADAEENKTKMTTTMQGTVDDMVKAVTNGAESIKTAAHTMMQACIDEANATVGMGENGQSSVFYNLGMNIDVSIASGITDNAQVITSSIQNALDSAANSVSFDTLVSKLNQALGGALG